MPTSFATFANAGRTVSGWLSALQAGDDAVGALARVRQAAQAAAPSAVWIHLCGDSAWAAQLSSLQARLGESADRSALLRRYPLLGVPFAVKDNIDIAGEPTTAACPAFAYTAGRSATVVQRLMDAGAVWIGKTNLDQFATGLVGTRSPFGRPASVADATRISGGSSSGSAGAVARGLVAFALGTDTAGSGRIPAGFNGLVGLKPTPGRVSTAGVVPACRTLDVVSIFSHTVDDAAHVLSVIEGPDPADPYHHWSPGPAALPRTLRLGVPKDPDLDLRCGYPAAWTAARAHAEASGHALVEVDFKALNEVAALLYEGPWVAERHAASREIFDHHPQAMDPTVRTVISRAAHFSATATFEAQYRLRALQASVKSLWDQVDALMVPTAPTHPTFAEVDADPLGANARLGLYTNFVNLLGWSALALPAGQTATGLPFGITLIAPGNADAALAVVGRAWERRTDSPAPEWLRRPATEPTLALAVVGAHLSGLPLNGQLIERGASLVQATTTAPAYRLFALPGTTPPKPGMLRVTEGGASIAVEVWSMPLAAVGSFLALIPAPLGLGSIELADGRTVHGFVCESHALAAAVDITHHGGWRAFMKASRPAA
jgi:allophanate hydrolase